MPSTAVLEQKKQAVVELTSKLQGSISGVVVDYKGISVADDTQLRKNLREAGVEYFVVKNKLLGLAADEAGLSELKDVLKGSTALAISSDDYVAGARILNTFAEKNNDFFEIKSGFIDGEVISVEKVQSLAKLPSFEGLIAKMMGSLKAPITNLVYALNAIKEKGEEQSA